MEKSKNRLILINIALTAKHGCIHEAQKQPVTELRDLEDIKD
jgi:hypothetical protein